MENKSISHPEQLCSRDNIQFKKIYIIKHFD